MNDKTFNLVMKILDSDLTKEVKTEIIKFYLLPRNTTVRPMIELPDDEQISQLGSIKRPDKHKLTLKNNPELAEEEKAMQEALKGIENG